MTSQTDADCLIILLTFLVKVYENYGLDAAGAYNYEYRRTVRHCMSCMYCESCCDVVWCNALKIASLMPIHRKIITFNK